MIDGASTALGYLLDPDVMLMVVLGVMLSQVIAAIPGLGGTFAMALVLPFAVTMDPIVGLSFLVAVMVTDGTGNTITSILFGVPGSASGVSAVFDGYPMAKRGEGVRAVSAATTASVLGGIIGAVFLVIALPVMQPLLLVLGPPEFTVLILFALFFTAYVGASSVPKAFVSAALGVMVGLVGQEQSTGALRFTFGQVYLWDGVSLIAALIGMYAVSEMIHLARRRGGTIVENVAEAKQQSGLSGIRRGVLDAFVYWGATLRSSLVGIVIGIMPGIGATAAQFIGYSYVAKAYRKRAKVPFGQGAIEGVIAADASTNSKDGGGFVPTLVFGIPGGLQYAVVLGAFLILGVTPGRSFLEDSGDLAWLIIFILVIANILAGAFVLSLLKWLVKLAYVRLSLLVPVVLCFCIFGAFQASTHGGDIIVALVFGAVGYAFMCFGYSRAIFVIALVLGPLLEKNFVLSYNLFGLGLFTRPVTLGLLGLLLLVIAVSVTRDRMSHRRDRAGTDAEITPQVLERDAPDPAVDQTR